jgi:two-component system, OmpR family, response regulator
MRGVARGQGHDPETKSKSMKILMIEDNPKIRGYVEKGMKEAGHTVDLAEDGETGLHLASTEKYDVLIIDRMLPKLDGLSIIKTLRGSGNQTESFA